MCITVTGQKLKTILADAGLRYRISQFFTASIRGRYKLRQHDQYKDIITNSLRFLVEDKRIKLYEFVIMSDHIHAALNTSSTCAMGFFKIYSNESNITG